MNKLDARITVAIEAFRGVEKAELTRDRKVAELNTAAAQIGRAAGEISDEDRAEYLRTTQEIAAEFEEKRAKAGL